jgi:hypothetical protein
MAARKPKRADRGGFEDMYVSPTAALTLESDRGCVLVAVAGLDEFAERLLRTHFKKACELRGDARDVKELQEVTDFLFEREPLPPLGSFGIKIRLCYVLGLIPLDQYTRLKRFGKLRNDFAHFPEPVEITSRDVASLGEDDHERLHLFRELALEHIHHFQGKGDAQVFSEPRLAFIACASTSMWRLMNAFFALDPETPEQLSPPNRGRKLRHQKSDRKQA